MNARFEVAVAGEDCGCDQVVVGDGSGDLGVPDAWAICLCKTDMWGQLAQGNTSARPKFPKICVAHVSCVLSRGPESLKDDAEQQPFAWVC